MAYKGTPEEQEVLSGNQAATICGFSSPQIHEYLLPGGSINRSLYLYKKTGEPTRELPRRVGVAQKRPLA
jgi:16S rRNA (guanine527-N7)-methyltransferase